MPSCEAQKFQFNSLPERRAPGRMITIRTAFSGPEAFLRPSVPKARKFATDKDDEHGAGCARNPKKRFDRG
jgi:hypothetical protein